MRPLPSASVFGAARPVEALLLQARLGFRPFLSALFLHGGVADQHRPDIGAGLRNHQHSDERNGVRPQHHRDIETKAQHDGQPHPAERAILMLFGAAIEQHDDQQTQQREGNVAVDAPRQRRGCAQPLVLRHHAKADSHGAERVHGGGQTGLSLDLIALPPDVVEQYIENGHGDGCDPLAQTKRDGVALKAGGAQRQRTRNQMEGISGSQHNGHQPEQPKLRVALAVSDHQNADGDDGYQIDRIEEGFNNCLHMPFSFFSVDFYSLTAANIALSKAVEAGMVRRFHSLPLHEHCSI